MIFKTFSKFSTEDAPIRWDDSQIGRPPGHARSETKAKRI